MPTIFRFRGFNIIIYVDDHSPAHVHVRGKGAEITYWLNCPDGPVTFRDVEGRISPNERRALEVFLDEKASILCEKWGEIDEQ